MIFPKVKVPVLQNRVFNSRNEALNSDFGYIQIEQNPQTGIFENVLFDSEKLIYDENYDNEQSNSLVFEDHLDQVINIILPYAKGKKIIEVGCGKGHFFRKLSALGLEIVGCDPTYVGDDPRIKKEFFSKDLGLHGDIIILRHVLEHIQNPVEFIKSISASNGGKGLVYIEVPDFNWIIENQVYFDMFYEHVNYFRPDDFNLIFNHILEQKAFFGSQYQYVIADLASINAPPYSFPRIADNTEILFGKLKSTLAQLGTTNRPVYIWGAASKGVISAIHLLGKGVEIKALIDINANKQNKFAAMTGVEIISPGAFKENGNGSVLLIANPNYELEIKKELEGLDVFYLNL